MSVKIPHLARVTDLCLFFKNILGFDICFGILLKIKDFSFDKNFKIVKISEGYPEEQIINKICNEFFFLYPQVSQIAQKKFQVKSIET